MDSIETIRVVLVDDHALLREGMRRLLEQEPDMTVVGEAADGAEGVTTVKALMPDVVLMDVVMPGISGIEATKQIKQCSPQTAVLILSAYDDDRYVLGLLEAGAAGYLLKSSHGPEVVQAIRAARTGDAVLHPAVTARLLAHVTRSAAADAGAGGAEHPTQRELEVLRLAAAGLGNKEIARELDLSLPTVKAHLVNAFNKMGVGSRTEAVLHALRRGWIHIEDVSAEPRGDLSDPPQSPG